MFISSIVMLLEDSTPGEAEQNDYMCSLAELWRISIIQ